MYGSKAAFAGFGSGKKGERASMETDTKVTYGLRSWEERKKGSESMHSSLPVALAGGSNLESVEDTHKMSRREPKALLQSIKYASTFALMPN